MTTTKLQMNQKIACAVAIRDFNVCLFPYLVLVNWNLEF
jgi:hypothetical protein